MSTRRPSASMFSAVHYGDDNMGGKIEARGRLARRPGLSIDTVAASDRTRRISEALKTGALARDPSAHELDNRGWYDADTDHRAAAPWAPKEAFNPVGLEGAFTPASMLSPVGYFPKMEDEVAPLPSMKSNSNSSSSSSRGIERRPAVRGRLQSAPAYLADRRHLPQVSQMPLSPPIARDAARTEATHNSNRRQTLPLTPARRPVPPPPTSSLLAPPQPRTPARGSNRSSVSGSSVKQSAGMALVKSVDRVKSFAFRAAKIGGAIAHSRRYSLQGRKESTYQKPISLAENALRQDEYVRYAADFANIIEGREVANFSPTSCDRLWRATSDNLPIEEKERAARVFAARQQVHHMPEARAQAEVSMRQMERARAAAAAVASTGTGTDGNGTSSPGHGRSRAMTLQEKQERYRVQEERYRMQEESYNEEQMRMYIAEQKDEAERLALEHPDRFPGLRRR